MRNTTAKKIKYGPLALAIVISAYANVIAQGEGLERSIEGVWEVTIMPRICATGVPIPGAANQSLYTFHKDGTMSVWTQNNVITTTRGSGQGLWRREHSWSDYSFKVVHLRYNLTTGAFLGKQEGQATLTLNENGDEFVTDGFATVFDVNGVPGTLGCSSSVGTRFKLEP